MVAKQAPRPVPSSSRAKNANLVLLGVIGVIAGLYVLHLAQKSDKGPGAAGSHGPAVGADMNDWPKWAKDDPAITVATLPPRRFQIIDDHEHLLDEQEARRVLEVMDRLGVRTAVLMGTSKYTLTLSNKFGFEGYKENNEEIIRIAKKYPDRFVAFPTIFPPEAGNLELLQDYVARGAAGLKLYLGHGSQTGKEPFHMMPLDDPRMKPIYRWAQEVQLPIQFHINLTKYKAEFVRVMEEFPYLRVCVPHFGLFKNDPKRLAELGQLFDRYPNMYSNVGFGFIDFQVEAFRKFDKFPSRYRDYLTRYADRFMYSSDMVVERGKTDAYIDDSLRSYMQVLEMDWYRFFAKPQRLYRGLALSDEALHKIYEETPRRFLLLDRAGHPPDRSKPWPWPGWEGVAALPGLPPAVPVVQPLVPAGAPDAAPAAAQPQQAPPAPAPAPAREPKGV